MTDSLIADFISLCDNAEIHSGHLTNQERDDEFKKIMTINVSTENLDRDTIRKITRYFTYQKIIFNKDTEFYFKIAYAIDFNSRNDMNFISFSQEKEWKKIIGIIKQDIQKDSSLYEFNSFFVTKIRLKNECEVFKYFVENENMTVEITLDGVLFYSDSKAIKQFVAGIESIIKKIGAKNILNTIFNDIVKFDGNTNRYVMHKQPFLKKTSPSLPLGYIVNLCLKNIHYSGEANYDNKFKVLLEEFFKKSSLLVALYDLDSYHIVEDMFFKLQKLIEYALYEVNYKFPQENPNIYMNFLDYVLDQIPSNILNAACRLQKKEIVDILSHIFFVKNRKIFEFSIEELIIKFPKINTDSISHFINILSHPLDKINSNFVTPLDYKNVNFFLKPFIKINDRKFLLINANMCIENALEAITLELRKISSNLDTYLGDVLEKFVYEQLKLKKINFKHGDFDGGQSDLIIESKNDICIFELKKKVLTRSSRSGQLETIVLDLFQSFLESQIQINKIKIILQKDEVLNLDNEGISLTVAKGTKSIKKISMVLCDFGVFQDRLFLRNLLLYLRNIIFEPKNDDPKAIEICKKINKDIKTFQVQLQKLGVVSGQDLMKEVSSSWFMPLSFFCYILNTTNNQDSFCKELTKNYNISLGHMDIWSNHNAKNSLGLDLDDPKFKDKIICLGG